MDEWAVQERLHGFGEPRAGAHYSVSPSETPVHPLSTFWSLPIESEVGEAEVGGWLQFPVWLGAVWKDGFLPTAMHLPLVPQGIIILSF